MNDEPSTHDAIAGWSPAVDTRNRPFTTADIPISIAVADNTPKLSGRPTAETREKAD